MTYLMWRRDRGFRIGTTRTYTNYKSGQPKPFIGLAQRSNQEHADASWVVSTHMTEADARFAEMSLSLQYRIPTVPFVARPNGAPRGRSLVGDQYLLDRLFAELDTHASGLRLLADEGLSLEQPHLQPSTYTKTDVRRRRLAISMCGDRRGRSPMHRIAIFGYDDHGREVLQRLGLSVRPARRGSHGWRFETMSRDMRADYRDRQPDRIRARRRRGATDRPDSGATHEQLTGNSLPFTSASSVRPGMVMFDDARRIRRRRIG